MKNGCASCAFDGGEYFLVGARDEDVVVRIFLAEHGKYDLRDLIGSLALAKNYLRVALPEGAMMVDLGEADILKG